MPRLSLVQHLGAWQLLIDSMKSNPTGFSQVEEMRDRLEELVARIRKLQTDFHRLRARFLKTARELREAVALAKDLESRLRAALKAHYGAGSNDLIQYGVKPRRNSAELPGEPKPVDPKFEAIFNREEPETAAGE